MNCSKCNKPFPTDEKGVLIIGFNINLAAFGEEKKKVEADFCDECWMEIWGVTPYLKEVK